MIVRIIRFIRGSVNCCAKGRFTERIINILNKKGFSYWGILPCDGGLSFNLCAVEYKRLRNCLRGTGIVTKINKKSGLPFLLKKYRARKGLVIGVVLFVAITVILSKFIWITTINGNEKVPTTKIMTVLEKNGLYEGAYIKSIDNKSLERRVMAEIPDIRWISVNITECKAEVEVKEKYNQPKIIDKNNPCNLKASRDALVLKTNVTNGTGVVKKGSAVAKGQLLISGVITGALGDSHFVKASGEVIGETTYHKTYKLPKRKVMAVPTGETKERSRGELLWFSVPLSFGYIPYDNYKVLTKTENLNINDKELPVSVTREYVAEIENKEISLKENKKALQTYARLQEAFDFKNKTIVGRKYKYRQDKENFYLDIDYTVNENICTKSPIYVEE